MQWQLDAIVDTHLSNYTEVRPNRGKSTLTSVLQLRFWHGRAEHALPAAERALAIDPGLPEPYCVKARYLQEDDRIEEANRQMETALRLDPDSWDVNKETAFLIFRQGRIKDAIPRFEKAASLMDTDYHDVDMLMTCYRAIDDRENE